MQRLFCCLLAVSFCSLGMIFPAYGCHKGGAMGFARENPGHFFLDITFSPSFVMGSTSGTSGCKNWDVSHQIPQEQRHYVMRQWFLLQEELAQ